MVNGAISLLDLIPALLMVVPVPFAASIGSMPVFSLPTFLDS
jgi:hypothetical protein